MGERGKKSTFVEDEDVRILDQSSGDCYSLLLATGQLRTASTDKGTKTVGEVLDESAICLAGGGIDLALAGFGLAVSDVLRDRTGEEDWFLGYQTDLPA